MNNVNDKILEIAASVLKVTPEEALEHSKVIEDSNLYYFWTVTRGGISVIINEDGEKLAAGSAISFEKLLEAFNEGKRN